MKVTSISWSVPKQAVQYGHEVLKTNEEAYDQ
jgi:hypothetical protein